MIRTLFILVAMSLFTQGTFAELSPNYLKHKRLKVRTLKPAQILEKSALKVDGLNIQRQFGDQTCYVGNIEKALEIANRILHWRIQSDVSLVLNDIRNGETALLTLWVENDEFDVVIGRCLKP